LFFVFVQAYADHGGGPDAASRAALTYEDVLLAMETLSATTFKDPPRLEYQRRLADRVNAQPLPPVSFRANKEKPVGGEGRCGGGGRGSSESVMLNGLNSLSLSKSYFAQIPRKYGLRLPPDSECLMQPSYRVTGVETGARGAAAAGAAAGGGAGAAAAAAGGAAGGGAS
jgi:hypothetical protein